MKNTNIRDLTIDQLGIVSGGNEIETQEDSENLFMVTMIWHSIGIGALLISMQPGRRLV